MTERKLGRRPHDPTCRALELGDVLTGVLPNVPASVHRLQGLKFGLYRNSTFGICGPTSVANDYRLVTARLTGQMVALPQEAVDDLYRRSGNPGFDPSLGPDDSRQDDNGVNMQQMLQALVAGGIGGVKPLAYARVNVKDPAVLAAAIAIFGGCLYGVSLQKAQQSQTDRGVWDYSPSGEWGGHAILCGGYGEDGSEEVVTWAEIVKATKAFLSHQLDEAWVVVWQQHLTDYGFLAGVDVGRLAANFKALTGKTFPIAVPAPLEPKDWDVIGQQD
jgi:hypothetical protein